MAAQYIRAMRARFGRPHFDRESDLKAFGQLQHAHATSPLLSDSVTMDLLKGDFSQAAVCDGMTVYNSLRDFGPVVGLHVATGVHQPGLSIAMVGVGLLVVMMPILCARVPSRA